MGLVDISLKSVYYSDEDNLLRDFYLPVLSNSVKYCRIAGYFCSNSFAIAAKGISNFIRNGGRIRLIANVILSIEDQEAIKDAIRQKEHEVLNEIESLEDQLKKDHIRMLCWMIRNNLLEIKIAVVSKGIEHQKIGILEDIDGNRISFSGSENETVQGWLYNDEQFHVFCSWKNGDQDHFMPEVKRFDCLWEDRGIKVRVFEVSEAFRRGLIKNAPKNNIEFEKLSQHVTEELLKMYSHSYGEFSEKMIVLRKYQQQAVNKWVANNCTGIFEMATGTGKTFAALGCFKKAIELHSSLITIITCPYQHLIQQWKREIEKFGLDIKVIIADSSNPLWKGKLSDSIVDISLQHKDVVAVLTTHDTFSSYDFMNIINNANGIDMFLIGDEVHGIGSKKRMQGLLPKYNLRLGLSATPKRWFDDVGSDMIFSYFGKTVFEFSLKDAINVIDHNSGQSFLTPFRYLPQFLSLSADELDDFISESLSITRRLRNARSDEDKHEILALRINSS
ncbi:MAG: DEAD/DEAH box helicase family protein, partial [Candidatus Thorarchaeota archaeon]